MGNKPGTFDASHREIRSASISKSLYLFIYDIPENNKIDKDH
jgi:hypothetical protein